MTYLKKFSIVFRWPSTTVALILVICIFLPVLSHFEVGYERGAIKSASQKLKKIE